MAPRYSFLALLLFSAATVAVNSDRINDDELLIRQVVEDNDDHLLNAEHHFSTFKAKFGKTYATNDEHDYHFGVFKNNLIRAWSHQKLDPLAVHGVTKFSNLTPSEFRRQFLGLKKPLRLPPTLERLRSSLPMISLQISIGAIMEPSFPSRTRVHVDRGGRLALHERWKELIFWRLASWSALVSNSLWIAIMRRKWSM